jgi:hypothetical protein
MGVKDLFFNVHILERRGVFLLTGLLHQGVIRDPRGCCLGTYLHKPFNHAKWDADWTTSIIANVLLQYGILPVTTVNDTIPNFKLFM